MTNDILTNWQQYRCEMSEHRRLTDAEEQALIKRALQGDEQAKHEIVQSCLWYVARVAQKYVDLPHDDVLDLVAEGNLALVEHIDRALSKANPFAYLMKVAALEIKHYVWYESHLIRRTDDRYPAIAVRSLDAPLTEKSNATLIEFLAMQPEEEIEPEPEHKKIYDELYQAIEQLAERQKYVVKRHYGMDGFGPESLGDISRRFSSNPSASLGSITLQGALKRLRKHLQAEI